MGACADSPVDGSCARPAGRVVTVDELVAGRAAPAPVARFDGPGPTPRVGPPPVPGPTPRVGSTPGPGPTPGPGGDAAPRAEAGAKGAVVGPANAEGGCDADPEVVARAICLRLLTARARTRQELARVLRRKGVPDHAARTVLERLADVGLVDDGAFAEQWVRSRHVHHGLGRRALAVELRGKGVADDVVTGVLDDLDGEAERRRARELVERRLPAMPTVRSTQGRRADPGAHRLAVARRLVGMLTRKGYDSALAYRVVQEALGGLDELGGEPVPDD